MKCGFSIIELGTSSRILQCKTNTGALHDQQGRSEQMDGHTHEDRSSDNTACTLLHVRNNTFYFWVYFLMTSLISLVYCGRCALLDVSAPEDESDMSSRNVGKRSCIEVAS
jgi:hypothetical protein